MSTSFYGSLPEATSDNAKSVPIPITTTVKHTYVEYTSSPDAGGIVETTTTTKKQTKYLDEADLDFEKTFQQQSAIVTTQNIQSSTNSSFTTTTTLQSETKESSSVQATESSKKDDKVSFEKPLGKTLHATLRQLNDVPFELF